MQSKSAGGGINVNLGAFPGEFELLSRVHFVDVNVALREGD